MTVRRVVPTSFWRSLEALDHYSQEDRYFALYLMTNPKCSQVGIYSLPKRLIAFETGFSMDQVELLLERFSRDFKKIIYSNRHQEVTLLHSLSYSIFVGGGR
ncbi:MULTISPECIES: hypothetical protein [Aerococcus]|uniref:Replication initiator A N-terminal domain-containing protein n=1 Tax=Aerococcus mictus TaxID=2976810 RepID=A0A1E9PKW6_9LACT|nr:MULTISPECIES: hypothetical protein [Aerococcus]KAA9290045.1 hypothetical protein F6I06_08995 [Aerococcus mictus]MBU5610880.1 hypothetical protein [Aerococcus urinae]MCY3031634.1 hypothetical protein [Aerococcus sp. Group 1]MCY3039758.1 hypothetical protein [Aerococcus sp. Group 2]MCY3041566.1 hypothetical protein [Aerococcus sp. Group 2]